MSDDSTSAYLIFTGTGPILALSSYPALTDDRLLGKLRYKGIDKFLAYQVTLDAVAARYPEAYEHISRELDGVEDFRVLDFNGHQIMANFSLQELGEPIKVGG
ncbi:MAG: hypothetical protein R2991_12820 [Thermoanaerobaculia bacterium]